MTYCSRCLYPTNHPLGIVLDVEGVCSGCRVHEEKDVIDWVARGKKLGEILSTFKSKNKMNYDCIIPVSGARDSHFIVDTIKNTYGLKPLLVTYNKQYNTKKGIRNLAHLESLIGCDLVSMTVSPKRVKRITRATLKRNGSMYWHCIAGQTVFPVQVAVRLKIPLIIWGAHQGLDQVGMYSHLDEVEMTRKYRKDHDLMGYEAEDLMGEEGLTKEDLIQFTYPHEKDIEKVGVRGLYLGNYIRWDSKRQHEDMTEKYQYETGNQYRTFDRYNDVDSFHYSDLHDYIKFAKFGYGKVTDHASREIRLRRMTREQGIELVKKYQNIEPSEKGLDLFLKWIGMGRDELFAHIDEHRDPTIWERDEGVWRLKNSVIEHDNSAFGKKVALDLVEDTCEFALAPTRVPDEVEDEYILYGKGWVPKPD